ncbi:EutN/CcmL family microcompartment protein [Myxococcota bacterium]|nr:EutN/CcmL family microcompartment protein [Myxococcota bacterium]
MELAKVTGTVVATAKYEGLQGIKLLVLQPLDETGREVGEPFVACDPLQAGPGDVVWWVTGREAALALPVVFVPVDASVVAIADRVDANRGPPEPVPGNRGGRGGP